jgi:3-keto-disaccharide hydrolase
VRSVEVRDGVLHIVREGRPGKLDLFEARLEGERLVGRVSYPDGTVHHFEGRKAPLLDAPQPVWGDPVTLFDGKTLEGWKLRDATKKSGWAARDGELVVVDPKGNADLVSERVFQDMRLHVEFNVDEHSNSGVYLRGRYEIQIESNDPAATTPAQKCGSLYSRVAPSTNATKPAGEWQSFDITLVGRQLTVALNDQEIVSTSVEGVTGGALNPFEDEPGPLMLQGDHGKVRFRNIEVTPAR